MGGIYKEQKELDSLPTIINPSLLTTKDSKSVNRKQKKLMVLQNFTSLQTCTCIMKEMKDASTDIIIVSNELFCKEEIVKYFDKHFSRGCNIIEVTNLQPISIMQRMVYGLLEKNNFVARDADHIVFTLLSEYSRGAATIVHLLTSLMQKCDDNSRTGFELAKQHLKLHLAHQRLENYLDNHNRQLSDGVKIEDSEESIMMKKESQITHKYCPSSQDLEQLNIACLECKPTSSTSKYNSIHTKTETEKLSLLTSTLQVQTEDIRLPEPTQTSSATSDVYITEKQKVITTPIHPLYMYINDILSTTISLTAHHLLNSLIITGPIPLPLFYVEELNNVVMNAVISKEKTEPHMFIFESPMKQLVQGGVIRNSCYPIVYHADLNPENVISNIQHMFIPKLICDAVKEQMDDTDKVLSTLCVQHALENLLTNNEVDLIHLHYILILCNQLHYVCTQELHEFGEELLIANQRLMLRISQRYKDF